ncbi:MULTISPECIES: CobW family GTP-binding protein [Bacillaceae]|uniref:CobW family GTP-binding protein n=1 Tax=Bacillaceae TaxID=186817 RepID=UPI001C590E82|nr:GTP-binding protein [Rossellomorea sp. YZS02]MBW3113186.1 GTP-binding protein [Bacillus sp. MCCB 382]MDX8343786.1 GTP-binding protein [Rossellomorea sp. YZS02]
MKKDVYILSGFLGSGKTTLLKELLQSLKDQNKKPAVLMNELGNVSIDSDAVNDDTALRELLDGCICCTISEKLESQLQELLLNEEFDVLIIETTGAAHPVEVVDSILSPLFANRFEFRGIITVVDGLQWRNRGDFSPAVLHLMREQIRHAQYIVANKMDLLTEMEQGTFSYELQQINQNAKVYLTNYSRVSMEDILSLRADRVAVSHERAPLGDHLTLQAVVYTFSGKVNGEAFEEWVKAQSDTIYRMKGYVPLQGRKHPTLFQYSYGMPLFMPGEMNYPTNFVIIGENLHKKEIIQSLQEIDLMK